MIVALVGNAPEIENLLNGAHAAAATIHTVQPLEMPTSIGELSALLEGRRLPEVVILAPDDEDPYQTLPLARILPVEQHVGVVIAVNELDAQFAIEALRSGASDVISSEPSLEELKSALSRASIVAQRASIPAPIATVGIPAAPAERGTVIAVSSAVGGVGKTFAALNLAVGLAGTDPGSCCIADSATQFGGVAHQLDIMPQFTMPDIVTAADPIAAKAYLTLHSSGLYVAPASEDPGALDRVDPAKIAETIEMLAMQFKTVIVDTETGLTPVTLEVLTRADALLVVSDFSVHSLRATHEYLKYANLIRRNVPLDIKLMMNREDPALAVSRRAAEEAIGMSAHMVLKSIPQIALAGNQGIPPMLGGVREKMRREISPLVDLFHAHDDPRRAAGRLAS